MLPKRDKKTGRFIKGKGLKHIKLSGYGKKRKPKMRKRRAMTKAHMIGHGIGSQIGDQISNHAKKELVDASREAITTLAKGGVSKLKSIFKKKSGKKNDIKIAPVPKTPENNFYQRPL